jgi:hypothetical protein
VASNFDLNKKDKHMITTVREMIEQYITAWNKTSLAEYRQEFAKCWAEYGVYIDPTSAGFVGVEAIAQFANLSLDIVPERHFELVDEPDSHHTYGRYTWKVTTPGGTNVGYDYFEFNEEFKITRLVSFFKLPADYPVDEVYGKLGQ